MKHYKTSILSTIIAGILVCGMLAACGAVEKPNYNPSHGENNRNNISDVQDW